MVCILAIRDALPIAMNVVNCAVNLAPTTSLCAFLVLLGASCVTGGSNTNVAPSSAVRATASGFPVSTPDTTPSVAGGKSSTCLLDPQQAGTTRADINWSTREVSVSEGTSVQVLMMGYQSGDGSYAYSAPTLAPSRRVIVIGANVAKGDTRQAGLWQIRVGERQPYLLFPTNNGTSSDVDTPAFSSDGTQIAFTLVRVHWRPTHGHDDTYEIWLMNADGSSARKIADGRNPLWSSNGQYIAFQSFEGPGAVIDAKTFQPVGVRSALARC